MPPAHSLRRLLAAFLVCLASIAGAGCLGGGDDGKDAKKPPIGARGDFQLKKSLVPKGDSAAAEGAPESYVPEGEIVADSGFRPEVDGFAFENYGNEGDPRNLGPAEMEALFGDQVCLSGTGDDCQLIPTAQEWMDNQNEGMAGGHCEGFSIAALRMFSEALDQEDFGGDTTAGLDIVGNDALQGSIAEHFVYQVLPPIVENRVSGTPSEVLDKLTEALDSGEEQYTLGVYKADGTAGHAITPFAIEDKGDGQFAILVYDNNFPGLTRAVEVDTNDDSWSYVSGTNPDDLGQVYQGDADTQTLELDPTTPGEEQQPCPFCDETAGDGGEETKGSLLPKDERYTEITLSGDPRNHPHLVFEDDDGNRTGIVDGRMLSEIEDVEVVKTFATQNWEGGPEPRYRLPEGADYTISVDGTDLDAPAKIDIDLVGSGLVIEIEDVKIAPGQTDAMALPGGYGITYGTDSKEEEAPNLYASLVEDDYAYTFAATAVGIKRGSTLSLVVEQENKVAYIDSTGGKGADGGTGVYILNLTRADAEGNIAQWQNGEVMLDGSKDEKAGFEYDESPEPGKPLPLVLLDANGDPTDTIEMQPQK
ncbi:MAG TPA: hypothetical protein VF517_16730 [Thermoleophilaceae bacterium]|jgi:hypothetical protein